MEKISWVYRVKNEALHRAKEERNTIKKMKGNWIGHIFRRNCFLNHVIGGKTEGMTEVRGSGGRRLSSYWVTLRKREDTRSIRTKYYYALCRGCGAVVIQTAE